MNYFVNEIGKYLGFKIIELNNTNLDEYFSQITIQIQSITALHILYLI